MTEPTEGLYPRRPGRWWAVGWRLALICTATALVLSRAAVAQSGDGDAGGQTLSVGTTVDLSVASVGPICGVTAADQTYLTIEDQGLWLLQADGKTIEKVNAPSEAISALATDGASYYIGTNDGLFSGRDPEWHPEVAGPISAICVQSDPPLYLAGGASAVWRSQDGHHWTAVDFPHVRVLRCVIAGSVTYAATTDGMYVSADSGQTWTERSSGLRARFIEVVALDGDIVYAGTGGAGVYVSADHARTWAAVNGSLPAVNDVTVTSGTISLLSGGALQQSTDGGETWTTQDAGGAILLKAVALINNVGAQQ